MGNESDTDDLLPAAKAQRDREKKSKPPSSGALAIPLTFRMLLIFVMAVGGPTALATAAFAAFEKWRMVDRHEAEIESIKSLVQATFRMQCKLCFYQLGAQSKSCGPLCEGERPIASE